MKYDESDVGFQEKKRSQGDEGVGFTTGVLQCVLSELFSPQTLAYTSSSSESLGMMFSGCLKGLYSLHSGR